MSVVNHGDGGWTNTSEAPPGSEPGIDGIWVKMYDAIVPGQNVRIALSEEVTVYVRKTGSDDNDGFSEETAKLTLRGAVSVLGNVDLRNSRLFINIGPGLYEETEQVALTQEMSLSYFWKGIYIVGAGATDSGTILTLTDAFSDRRVLYTRGGIWTFKDLWIKGGIEVRDHSLTFFEGNMKFGNKDVPMGRGLVAAVQNGLVRFENGSSSVFVGSAQSAVRADNMGAMLLNSGALFSFEDAKLTNGFVYASNGAFIYANVPAGNFTGSFVGPKFTLGFCGAVPITMEYAF